MSMTIEGAYNILSDPAITESSELPIAVKALIALANAYAPPKSTRSCYCRSNEICDRCHWAKGSRCRKGCTCGRNFPFNQGERIRRKDGGQQGVVVGTGVRRDGDSYASHLIVGEWEPV